MKRHLILAVVVLFLTSCVIHRTIGYVSVPPPPAEVEALVSAYADEGIELIIDYKVLPASSVPADLLRWDGSPIRLVKSLGVDLLWTHCFSEVPCQRQPGTPEDFEGPRTWGKGDIYGDSGTAFVAWDDERGFYASEMYVMAHEMGHGFKLKHTDLPSIMNQGMYGSGYLYTEDEWWRIKGWIYLKQLSEHVVINVE